MSAAHPAGAKSLVDEHVVEQESRPMSDEEKVFYDAALASLDKESRVRLLFVTEQFNLVCCSATLSAQY